MRRASSASSTGSLSTPVVSRQWGSQRDVDVQKQLFSQAQRALPKLRALPQMTDFEHLVTRPDLPPHLRYSLDVVPSEHLIDPVSLLRRMLRTGAPLSILYNAVIAKDGGTSGSGTSTATATPLQVLTVDEAQDIKLVKRAIYHFCEACVHNLGLNLETDLFTISHIFSDSTADLYHPLNTLQLLLTRLDPAEQVVAPPTPTAPTNDQRSNVVDELLQTERKYVQDLETLLVYHDAMLALGMPRETVAKICPGLPKMVEFQRRFLVGCEFQASEFKPEEQNFGWLFLHMRRGFEVYRTYTLGQKEATQTALNETGNLMRLSHILEPLYELPATLLKPVQRIMRYPLLLKEILKHTPSHWIHHQELQMALAAMHEMMADVNETQRRAENQFVTRELQDRVKDWKGLELASMGDLLLSGVFPVSMGDSEQEYSLYLFERVLLCFKDRVTTKKTPLTKIRPSASSASSAASRHSQGKSMSLELKGRIYLGYITSVTTTKLATGGYLLRLGWGYANDASEHGGFDLRLANEELAQMWESTIQKLAATNRVNSGRSSRSNSVTSFTARASQISLSQLGRYVGSIDEDHQTVSDRRASYRNSAGTATTATNGTSGTNAIQFWDEAPTPSSSVDALRKLSVSSTSSQHSSGGASGASRTSLTLSQNTTPPVAAAAAAAAAAASSSSSSSNHYRNMRPTLRTADSSHSLTTPGQRKVRIHVQGDTFLILVTQDLKFEQLVSRVERKLKLCGKMAPTDPASTLIFEYIDEDEDRVRLESDEDLLVAFEAVPDHYELSIYVNS